MQTTALKYGFARTLNLSFDQALEKVKEALPKEGFGIQAEIDISRALKEKLGVEVPRLLILGVCNPPIAYKALQAEPEIGLLLPCNVTLRQTAEGTEVAVIDAGKMMEFVENPALKPLGDEVKKRLQALLDSV